jgi:hypothetical protein
MINKKVFLFLFLSLLIIIFAACGTSSTGGGTGDSGSGTGVVTLNWDPPTQYSDGSPLSPNEIVGYTIYYGTSSATYTDSQNIENGNATMYTLNLPRGTYYFVITAHDVTGFESSYSNEVNKTTN